ncbi:MAG: tetratricopeptide repeat protein, partial [Alphaproteobacteria bacterium]
MADAAPDDPVGVALAALRAGRVDEAERGFRAILAAAPGNRDAMHGLGVALAAADRPEQAMAWLDRAIADGAVPATWHANRGAALHRLGRHGEAAAAYRAAIARGGEGSARMHVGLGDAAMAAREFAAARDAYARVVALSPEMVVAWNNLGNALQELGEIEPAIAAYGRALALRADLPETLTNLANALNAGDRAGEALQAVDRALALRPDLVPAMVG